MSTPCARPTCDHPAALHSSLSGCLAQIGPGYCACQEFVQPRGLTAPETPYAGTSGWSGSDTSRERAQAEDDNGTTLARQARVLEFLAAEGHFGATWKELGHRLAWHHGQASGSLSVLHKTGHVARLTERRNRCAIYVLPQFVQGRETADHGRKAREVTCPSCSHTFSA